MKDFIYQHTQSTVQALTVEQIFFSMVFALLLGCVIFISYRFSHSGAVYSGRFNVSLLMMTMITTMIMNVIGNNIALSLGMVGALSIVRFRTAIKDSRDTAYIFWCIAVGICCGVSYFALAAIGTGFIFLVMLAFGTIKANDRYLLIIHADDPEASREIEQIMLIEFAGKAKMRVANRSAEKIEYIYELSSSLIVKAKNDKENVTEKLMAVKGVQQVNLACQNEEMSR